MASLVKVSGAASLALHAAILLAQAEGGFLRACELCRRIGASQAHLAKVLQTLSRAGLVRTERGRHGGTRLARPASAVTLLEVYEAVEGRLESSECLLERPICDGRCCQVGRVLYRMNETLREHLGRTSLADACAGGGAKPARQAGTTDA